LQLRQDELKTQIVAAQAANWHDAPRAARNGAAMAVQYGDEMAKGQLRSNREKKKPKADKNKSKTSIPASPWAPTQFQPTSARPSTGKKTP
jgi:hypothetical protein